LITSVCSHSPVPEEEEGGNLARSPRRLQEYRIIEEVPHRHADFSIPKRLRGFFKYDRKLSSILFRAAWGALREVLGADERELAAIFTVQTAGEALNYHPHLHGPIADGYWIDGVFTRFSQVNLKVTEQAFAEGVLAQLHKLAHY
jgi:hypothetical protein